jgi:hypothetical protein
VISNSKRVGVSGRSTSSGSDELRYYEREWWRRWRVQSARDVVASQWVSVTGHRARGAAVVKGR